MQIKAGLKKEFLFFSRTYKLLGAIFAVFAFSVADPLMIRLLEIASESIGESMGNMFNSGMGFMTAVSDITATSLLIVMIILMGTAGGEQKKRSVIIPNTAGLTNVNYTLPKFILYPIFFFVVVFLGTMLAAGVSVLTFGESIPLSLVMMTSLCSAAYYSFFVVIHLTAGICTGRPGYSVIFLYVLSSVIPMVLQELDSYHYNPFGLKLQAMTASLVDEASFFAADANMVMHIVINLAIAAVVSVILYFLTLFVLHVRKTDNADNEPVL